jgi:hypothetical protein
MTLGELYLCARQLFEATDLERGLQRVARLGRYGQSEEREAALLLDISRAGRLTDRALAVLNVSMECSQLLSSFTGKLRSEELRNIVRMGDIGAARVLLCDCHTRPKFAGESREQTRAVVKRLISWLPAEALTSIQCGPLGPAQLQSLFATRGAEINFL